MNRSFLTGTLFLLLFSATQLMAQQGHWVSASGLLQYTKLSNTDDYFRRTTQVVPRDTYKGGFALDYGYNFEDRFGFQAGIHYANQGQDYTGNIIYTDTTNGLDSTVNYESSLTLSYLKVPVMFNFNSIMDNDMRNVFLTMGAGFQVEILNNVSFENNKGTPSSEVDLTELYKSTSISFVAQAIFNIRITNELFAQAGIKLDRGITSIEETDYIYPDGTPLEYYFPVSTTKESIPDLNTRDETKHVIFALKVGLSYRIAGED